MLGFGAISEFAISAGGPIPFAGIAGGSAFATGTPSLIRVSSGLAYGEAVAFGSMTVTVFASGAAYGEAFAYGRPNYVIYASTRPFISRPSDQISNQPFVGRLQQTIQFDRSIVNSDGFGQVALGWGELTLINLDGYFDSTIRKFTSNGRRVRMTVGKNSRKVNYDNFYTIFDGISSGIHVEEEVVRVFIRDNTFKLETPAQPNTYTGLGGLGGTTELAGKRIPLVFGYVLNITPSFVIPSLKLFQVHDGPVNAITAVYSRGATVAFDQDYPDAASLMAASIIPGRYSTCLSCGLFRVNFVLEGVVTADVEGDNTDDEFVSTTADIIQRLFSRATEIDEADIEWSTFVRVNELRGADIGYFLSESDESSVADVVDDLVRGIKGFAGFRPRDNKFEVGVFRLPTGITPSARYRATDIIDIKREPLPSGLTPPPRKYQAAWGRNWTPQTDIAGTVVDVDRIQFLKSPYRLASTSQDDEIAILTDWPQAQVPQPIQSYYRNAEDAQEFVEEQLEMFGFTANSLYRITLKARCFTNNIGGVVNVDYDRFGLDGGRPLTVVSVSDRTATNESEILGVGP